MNNVDANNPDAIVATSDPLERQRVIEAFLALRPDWPRPEGEKSWQIFLGDGTKIVVTEP